MPSSYYSMALQTMLRAMLFLKTEGEQTDEELQELANQQTDGSARDKFLQNMLPKHLQPYFQHMKVKLFCN